MKTLFLSLLSVCIFNISAQNSDSTTFRFSDQLEDFLKQDLSLFKGSPSKDSSIDQRIESIQLQCTF